MDTRDPQTNPALANRYVRPIGIQYETNPGAEYGEHIMNTGAICNTAASHTYGNVVAIIEKYLLENVFPQDLFKTVLANTTLASRQITHLPHQLHKKEMPIMVLIPRINFSRDNNAFLSNTLMASRITNTHAFWGDGSLIPLAEDKKNKTYIHGHYNRCSVDIDIVLSFNTYSEQINYMAYLNNMVPLGHNQFIKAPLELYIPEEFCSLISHVTGNPIEENNSVYKFLTYMNKIWHYPITYKLKGGSNTNEFFMYYIADLDVVIGEPQAGAGIKDGQIKRAFDISFTVSCEFNTIGYFTLDSPNIKKHINLKTDTDKSIIPIFSDSINLNDFDLPIGWSILGWPIFKLKYGENSVSIDGILNDSLRVVIDHHLQHGIPMERFIKIQFRENGLILDDEAFYIDWQRRTLFVVHPNIRRTYRLIITVSNEYVNELIKQLYHLE